MYSLNKILTHHWHLCASDSTVHCSQGRPTARHKLPSAPYSLISLVLLPNWDHWDTETAAHTKLDSFLCCILVYFMSLQFNKNPAMFWTVFSALQILFYIHPRHADVNLVFIVSDEKLLRWRESSRATSQMEKDVTPLQWQHLMKVFNSYW